MANVHYAGFEVATSLVYSYEQLAIKYRDKWSREESRHELKHILNPADTPPVDEGSLQCNVYVNFDYGLALLVLNAAIVEGTLRSVITERMGDEIRDGVKRAVGEGRTGPTYAEELQAKSRIELEVHGGWEKLREQYSSYFKTTLQDAIGDSASNAMEVLFRLRNVLAHGTAIVYPMKEMDESMKSLYPYDWQRRMQMVDVYLKKHFKKDVGLVENLAQPGVPKHFLDATKKVFEGVCMEFGPLPKRVAVTTDLVRSLQFGYMLPT